MGPAHIRHRSHHFATRLVILRIKLVGKPKWLPLKSGYHEVMQTRPIPGKLNCIRASAILAFKIVA